MAAEAVYKIKEAEEKGTAIIRYANEKANEIIQNAVRDGAQRSEEIIEQAYQVKSEIIKASIKNAYESCMPMTEKSNREIAKIKNPDGKKLEIAINAVIERIVKNGDS